MSSCCVPGTVLDTGWTVVKETGTVGLCPQEARNKFVGIHKRGVSLHFSKSGHTEVCLSSSHSVVHFPLLLTLVVLLFFKHTRHVSTSSVPCLREQTCLQEQTPPLSLLYFLLLLFFSLWNLLPWDRLYIHFASVRLPLLEPKLLEGRDVAMFSAVLPEPGTLIAVEGQTFWTRTVAWLPKYHQPGLQNLVGLPHVDLIDNLTTPKFVICLYIQSRLCLWGLDSW